MQGVFLRLAAQAKLLDQLAIPLKIGPLQVGQQPPPVADQLQEAPPAVEVVAVGPDVLGEVVDPLGKKRDLDLSVAGVPLVGAKPLDQFPLLLSAYRRCLCHLLPAG